MLKHPTLWSGFIALINKCVVGTEGKKRQFVLNIKVPNYKSFLSAD